jgi:hypothetical protein
MTNLNTWLLLAAVYTVKFLLKRGRPNIAVSLLAFAALLASSVIFIWARVVDWSETFNVDPKGHWIGTPIMLLLIPTATFVYDTVSKTEWATKALVLRYAIEILVFPAWAYFWIMAVEGPILDWWWI